MLTGGPNYTMIGRVIFGKVRGHGVQGFWLISQFPAKYNQWRQNCVHSPRVGSTFGIRSWSYKQWVHNLYRLVAPKGLLSEIHQLLFDPLESEWGPSDQSDVTLVVRSVYKQSCEKIRHFSLYVQNISGYRKKNRSSKYQNKMPFQISLSPFENYFE